MSSLADVRRGLAAALDSLPERKLISYVGGNYDSGIEHFAVQITAGEPSPEAEARLELLLEREGEGSVMSLLYGDPTLEGVISDLAVRSHSGIRAFTSPDGTPELGTELSLDVVR